ncbi:MAG: VanZ family protein [Planctomycetota bacterium]
MRQESGKGNELRPGGRFLESMSRWPATTLVAAAIIAVSEIPEPVFPRIPLFPHADKAVHVIEYLVLGALLFRSLCYELSGNLKLAAIIVVTGGTIFGVCDEWHQGFTGRTPDVWDALADVAGLLCGVACVLIARRWSKEHVN